MKTVATRERGNEAFSSRIVKLRIREVVPDLFPRLLESSGTNLGASVIRIRMLHHDAVEVTQGSNSEQRLVATAVSGTASGEQYLLACKLLLSYFTGWKSRGETEE